MHTMTLRLDDQIAQPAIEAAKAMGVSLNEYVSRAVVASLTDRQATILAGVREDMERYSAIVEYLGTH
jgi:predicted transcriptional regulator